MPTVTLPLTGARNFRNQFSLPADPLDDTWGEKMFDLRRLLRGEHGVETEIGEELRKTVPNLTGVRGTLVPWSLFSRGLSTRDMVAGTPGLGGNLVQTERLPQVVDALRPHSVCIQNGCAVFDNLTDKISVPRWQTPSSPQSLLETVAVTSGSATTSLAQLSPHRISTMVIISRQLLIQGSSMSLENHIRTELLRSIGQAVDAFALAGSGVGSQPLGVLNWPANTAGLRDLGATQPPVTFGATPSWAQLVEFPGSIAQTDVAPDGTEYFVTSPLTAQRWAAEPKMAGFPSYLLEDGKVAGFPLKTTNSLAPSHRVIFARWSSLALALWPLSLMTDPYSLAANGNTRIFCDIFCDCAPLVGPAFALSSDSGAQ
jgi:hypothetical protein